MPYKFAVIVPAEKFQINPIKYTPIEVTINNPIKKGTNKTDLTFKINDAPVLTIAIANLILPYIQMKKTNDAPAKPQQA